MAEGHKNLFAVVDKLPLDDSFYKLEPQELAFFKFQTGIEDEAKLKEHLSKVQADAYEVYPYPCIRRFAFTKLKISHLPAYGQLLKLGKERPGAIFLDIGCCFGNDVRKAVVDGFPVETAIASDLEADFWRLGHQLFNSTPETFPVPFVPGDAFDTNFLKSVPPFDAPPEAPRPDLHSLKALTPLLGHVSAIHASLFFHLFNEEQQLQLARSVAGLLSPEPGSVIFGAHVGRPEKGLMVEIARAGSRGGGHMFCHSPESWIELWDGVVFDKGKVKVDASLVKIEDAIVQGMGTSYGLVWSVTRL